MGFAGECLYPRPAADDAATRAPVMLTDRVLQTRTGNRKIEPNLPDGGKKFCKPKSGFIPV